MTTKNLLQPGLIAVLSLALTTPAQAATLTFDDLKIPNLVAIPNGYGSFTWENFGYDSVPHTYPGTGYGNGIVSPSTVIYNDQDLPAIFSRTEKFDFNSAYLTAAWSNGLNVLVRGFSDTTQTYSRSLVLNIDRPTLINFDFLGVDRVVFTAAGGVDIGSPRGEGPYFVLDDLTFSAATPPTSVTPPTSAAVPEPTTLLGISLAGVGLAAARRRSQGLERQ
jgi:hypothetical protein